MDEMAIIYMLFILAAAVMLLVALILRILRKRFAAKILLLIGCGLLIAYSTQFFSLIFEADKLNAEQFGYISLFIFSVILGIYELTTLVSKR